MSQVTGRHGKEPQAAAPAEDGLQDGRPRADEGRAGKRGGRGWKVLFVISLVVFIASLTALGVIAYSYFQGQQKYEEVSQVVNVVDVDEEDLASLTVDWDALLAANPDTVAWLYVPNTSVNYPVVRGGDNEFYLTHDFDGDAGWLANYGCIFMDYRNDPQWTDAAYFIYGHHMRDGSMFADFAHFSDQELFDASRTMYVLSPHGNFRLRTFSFIHCAADDPLVQTGFESAEAMTEYIQDKIDRSLVDPGDIPAADKMRKLFAFATCDGLSSGRYVLYAYVEDTDVSGLQGVVGIASEDGEAVGFQDDLTE